MKFLNKLKSDRQDLINNLNENIVSLEKIAFEQQAEIEQWKEKANKYQNLWCEAVKDAESIKTEAIKEFAEEYKDHIKSFTGMFSPQLGFTVSLDAVLYAVDFVCEKMTNEMVGDE